MISLGHLAYGFAADAAEDKVLDVPLVIASPIATLRDFNQFFGRQARPIGIQLLQRLTPFLLDRSSFGIVQLQPPNPGKTRLRAVK